MEKLCQLLSESEYAAALNLCVSMEVRASVSAVDLERYYTYYLALLLVNNDAAEVTALWARAPENLKGESGSMEAVWSIGRHILDRNPSDAHTIIQSAAIPNELAALMSELTVRMRQKELDTISCSYSRITLDDFAGRLGMQEAQAIQTASSLGWSTEEQSRCIVPKPIGDKNADESSQASSDLMKTLSQYVAHFETKPLDISSTSAAASTN